MALGGVLLEPIVNDVTQRILDGKYAEGERLPTEARLQEQYGVSRSVIREAMKVLSSRGLVRIEQGRGTFVCEAEVAPMLEQMSMVLRRDDGQRRNSRDDLDYLQEVRSVLEVAVAERAAQNANDEDLRDLASAIAAMRARPADVEACTRADLLFHRTLTRAAGNPLWPAILGSLNDLLKRLVQVGHHGRANALQTANEHQKILDAISQRDATSAASAMRAHLDSSGKDLLKARKKRRA
jgi:GntR family transcriptional repressor for pyruvate dehydrogenase complex